MKPPGVRNAVSAAFAVTTVLRLYTLRSCSALANAAPEQSAGNDGSRYDTGNFPALCVGGGIPSTDAPKDATSA